MPSLFSKPYHHRSILTADEFFHLGQSVAGRSCNNSKRNRRRFRSYYGTTPLGCSLVWRDLVDEGIIEAKSQPVHFLWAIHYLKTYKTQENLAAFCRCKEETAIKWCWHYIRAIKKLKALKVSLSWLLLSSLLFIDVVGNMRDLTLVTAGHSSFSDKMAYVRWQDSKNICHCRWGSLQNSRSWRVRQGLLQP